MSYLKRCESADVKVVVRLAGLLALVCTGCGTRAGEGGDTAPTEGTTSTTGDPAGSSTSTSTGGTAVASSSSGGSSSGGDESTSTSTGALSSSSTGEPIECTKTVVLMGYWPPSNEMLRPFSTDPELNPDGWVGEDWRGLGFDVHAFFPEFPPDGDPSNDPIGSPGSVGSEASDLQVDYQDTSADFWRIVDTLQPHILITHSRGGGIGWELEAIEGGHGNGGADPAFDWASDGYGAVTQPTQESVDPRSWDAMQAYRDVNAQSLLPLKGIESAASGLGLTSVEIDGAGTSGNYLSGFLGLHGIVYAESTPHAVAGGHIHVGITLPVADARVLVETSLEVVLQAHPAQTLDCPPAR